MLGILLQWNVSLSPALWWTILVFASFFLFMIAFWSIGLKYRMRIISGIMVCTGMLALGALLVMQKDIRNDTRWIGNQTDSISIYAVRVEAAPVEKDKTFKVTASFVAVKQQQHWMRVSGGILLYFSKDSSVEEWVKSGALMPGRLLIFQKKPEPIRDAGNPGGFDYSFYCLRSGITHQCFLRSEECILLSKSSINRVQDFLQSSRDYVLNALRRQLPPGKEAGLAEALLIGYRDDLDPLLVQSYSRTGVVHIIAISGLHLGLIYWLLALLFSPLQQKTKLRWLRAVLVLGGLWLFALLAGAQPSVLRSAVMFTFIVLGEAAGRRTNIFNTLAASAFVLLCLNPFWLWDIGFQLSYSAVLSIVIFMKPVYHLFSIKNRVLDAIWKMNALSIAAQVLTVPLSIYHFHQFPTWFLLSNLLAIPLSSIILLGELVLLLPGLQVLTHFAGKGVYGLIWLMNTWIERVEQLPFSSWQHLQISEGQTLLLYIFIAAASMFWWTKKKGALMLALFSLLLVTGLRTLSFYRAQRQHRVIVFNRRGKPCIDLAGGRTGIHIGDRVPEVNNATFAFTIEPARTRFRYSPVSYVAADAPVNRAFMLGGKHILWIHRPFSVIHPGEYGGIDLLILSRGADVNLRESHTTLGVRQVVLDATVPASKLADWQAACASLHIPCHVVQSDGAFMEAW